MSAQTNSIVGSLLGKDYRVLEQIGAGGMAVVYLVEHQTLLKRFAAKVLSEEHASNKEARARFAQEAHAASQLDHENIVTISDFGVTPDERPFYVMELLRGRTLAARLEEGPMTIADVVAVAVPVARALAHAHAEGVIHRDVKPENVFLVQRSQGRWSVKVLDFGIAKVTSNPALTKMGQALGSPMFMAPEACRGDDVDQRADLYSFGILLYLMLTGRVPFEDESLLKVLQMQVTSPVPPPRELNPELSPELEAVVLRALEKKPDDRYPTMDALLFELQAVLPEGSDSVLVQAQFGTSLTDTPFPGQSLRMIALSSQRLMVGDQDAASKLRTATGSRFPSAPPPKGKRGALIAVAVVAALAAGGVGYWQYTKSNAAPDDRTVAAGGPTMVPTPAPVPEAVAAPANEEPPAPRVVGPAEPIVDSAVVAAATEPVAETKPTAKPTVKRAAEPPPKKVAAAAPKVTTTKPAVVVAAVPETKPAVTPPETKPAISVAPTGVPQDTIRVEPPKPAAGSAAPPVVAPVPAKPAVVNVGTLDATPAIASLDVNGPLPSSVVRRGVERILPALRTCYRTAAKTRGMTPAVNVSLSFEIDESGAATSVSASGAANLATLASCAKAAVGRLNTQQAPDVGTVHVVVAISFRPT
jgi:serine/threonine protein kinase/outer membrane biosynthesis protein TonB